MGWDGMGLYVMFKRRGMDEYRWGISDENVLDFVVGFWCYGLGVNLVLN
jgi:hypothetical protein